MVPNQIRRMVASKDYIALADEFSAQVDVLMVQPGAAAELATVRELVRRLAEVLKAQENRGFDVVAFARACGIDRLR